MSALPSHAPPARTERTAAELVAVDAAFQRAVNATHILIDVEARLTTAGAIVELRQLQGLSAQETDVLVHREMHQPTTTQEPRH